MSLCREVAWDFSKPECLAGQRLAAVPSEPFFW